MKTIGIISLKGGVGKTSTVVALGSALSEFGKKVLLVDGNFSSPNLGMHLNVIEPENTLHHVLGRKSNIADATHKLPNFDLIPASIFADFAVNPLRLKDRIKHLRMKYDNIILDSSPAFNNEMFAVLFASDQILVVTTPDYPTLTSTLKAIKLAREKGIPISGLILNKVYNKNFELSIKDIEYAAEVPVMAVIPHDINISKSLSAFKSITEFRPHSEGAEEYRKLAATLIGEKYKPFKVRRFFRWVNPKHQDINREIYYKSIFE